jgi:hypothetical protein
VREERGSGRREGSCGRDWGRKGRWQGEDERKRNTWARSLLICTSVIMDVMNVEQAKIAEEAGASAVMALGEC